MALEIWLLIFSLLYLLQVGVFVYGIRKTRDRLQTTDRQPFVSVVIAARNEEQNIPACLESVTHQSYPPEQYEVIVANDKSDDRTEEICREVSQKHKNITSFIVEDDPVLKGKTNALNQGIERAKGEIILITDADCVVPPTWVEWTSKRYDPTVGIVGGITLQKATNWFEGIQSLDWAYLLGLASSTVSLRNPLSTIGNNLSFRKSAYQEVGGFGKIPFSVTEDFMLFQSIVKQKKWEYLYPIDSKVLVMSHPCTTWKSLFRQKHRWGKGGLDMKMSGLAIMVIGFFMHGLALSTFLFGSFMVAATALLIKMIADYTFLHHILKRLERTDLLKHFYPFQLYYILYVLMLPFIVFFGGKVIWKGRSY